MSGLMQADAPPGTWQMSARRLRSRRVTDRLMRGLIWLSIMLAVVPLLFILGWIALKGAGAINLDLFTQLPGPPDDPHTGFANGIVGTLILVGIASVISVPVGIGAGIYLSEFGGSKTNIAIRFATDVLVGVPSITIGVFVYTLMVRPMGSFSAIAGGVALSLVMIPLIVRSTEEMLKLVPQAIREAALALGAPVWRTVLRYALPMALPGVITGILLAMARAAGETAPLLFTALGNNQWSAGLDQPVAALTLQVYFGAQSAYEVQKQQAWAGALVLVALVFITSVLARLAVRRAHARTR
ncbi:MAG TPA: phosphate ABC transporter permease PstA [Chloroflexia bacterium]|nr:phosphate ABC transporter permease PstA [Chloroflexia bacterium]